MKVRRLAEHIVDTRQPDPRAVTLNRLRLVRQNVNILPFKRRGHMALIGLKVVISHYRPESVGCCHLPQEGGARFRGAGRLLSVYAFSVFGQRH